MTGMFGSVYADAYDLLYREKNYDEECRLLTRVLQRYAGQPVRRILDLGCGTGNHALRLAADGYEVVGVDRSPEMLQVALRKAAERGLSIRVSQADIRHLNLAEIFDAALMMFAVLGYQLENTDVLQTLRAARQHLRPGGVLVFDVWYGPAVLAQRPHDRLATLTTEATTVLRASSGELDVRRQVCTVHFHLWRFENARVLEETRESHPMRYFFPRELELLLEAAGFTLYRLGAFPDIDREPDETTWNVIGVAGAAP